MPSFVCLAGFQNHQHYVLTAKQWDFLSPTVPFKEDWGNFSVISENDPVAGRNPAPVDRWFIPLFTGFYTFQVVSRISEPSTVPTIFFDKQNPEQKSICETQDIKNTVVDIGVAANGTYEWTLEFQCKQLGGFFSDKPSQPALLGEINGFS